MTDREGVLIVRDDGVYDLPNAVPVVYGLVETIERLFEGLGIPASEERRETEEER